MNTAQIVDPWLNGDPCKGCTSCERVCMRLKERVDAALATARREGFDACKEQAAAEEDCGCDTREKALAAKDKTELWMACPRGSECCAVKARSIRALEPKT